MKMTIGEQNDPSPFAAACEKRIYYEEIYLDGCRVSVARSINRFL